MDNIHRDFVRRRTRNKRITKGMEFGKRFVVLSNLFGKNEILAVIHIIITIRVPMLYIIYIYSRWPLWLLLVLTCGWNGLSPYPQPSTLSSRSPLVPASKQRLALPLAPIGAEFPKFIYMFCIRQYHNITIWSQTAHRIRTNNYTKTKNELSLQHSYPVLFVPIFMCVFVCIISSQIHRERGDRETYK